MSDRPTRVFLDANVLAKPVTRTFLDADIDYVRVPDDVRAERADNANTAPGDTADAADDAGEVRLPASAYVYRPNAILDAWLRILCGTCQWPHCDAPAWNADLDHDAAFDHAAPTRGGTTTAAGMKPYCRTHHRIRHSGCWAERHNPDRSIDYISPTAHRYRSRTAGYLDLLGIDPDHITDPDPEGRPRRRRRTRAQNKAANIRAERRRQQTHVDLKKLRHTCTGTGEPPPDDAPCPF